MVNAIVLAGGLGTRLKAVVSNVPKPLAPINGVAFLDLLLHRIEQSKVIDKIILAIGYQANLIIEHFTKQPRQIPIEFSVEDRPLGTGGAIYKAMSCVDSSRVFVFNGDSYLDCSLATMMKVFRAPVTMAYTHVDVASRFGQIEIDEQGRIVAFREKENVGRPGFINGGIYLFDSDVFNRPMPEVFSLENNLFPELLKEGIFGFFVNGRFIDIGTPESFLAAQTILGSL